MYGTDVLVILYGAEVIQDCVVQLCRRLLVCHFAVHQFLVAVCADAKAVVYICAKRSLGTSFGVVRLSGTHDVMHR